MCVVCYAWDVDVGVVSDVGVDGCVGCVMSCMMLLFMFVIMILYVLRSEVGWCVRGDYGVGVGVAVCDGGVVAVGIDCVDICVYGVCGVCGGSVIVGVCYCGVLMLMLWLCRVYDNTCGLHHVLSISYRILSFVYDIRDI